MSKNNHPVDQGNLFVIAAPSGTGKTTLVKALVESLPKITVSISHTTRNKRASEQHGTNYFFVEFEEFKRMIAEEDFLEHAEIFEHHYGTSKETVSSTLAKGVDVILEIDWQGHQQIKQLFPDAIGIFILPPSFEDLRSRLIKRNQDHPEIIKKRLTDAKETISHLQEFDYVIINDDFSRALVDLKIIVEATRLKRTSQHVRLTQMVQSISILPPAADE
ncbi:MAG: guanylate kinase [Gammaproteobacteria bacterium]|nr:guanylate kinase [Gammaproteobacteria bacterium]